MTLPGLRRGPGRRGSRGSTCGGLFQERWLRRGTRWAVAAGWWGRCRGLMSQVRRHEKVEMQVERDACPLGVPEDVEMRGLARGLPGRGRGGGQPLRGGFGTGCSVRFRPGGFPWFCGLQRLGIFQAGGRELQAGEGAGLGGTRHAGGSECSGGPWEVPAQRDHPAGKRLLLLHRAGQSCQPRQWAGGSPVGPAVLWEMQVDSVCRAKPSQWLPGP